MLHFVKVQVHQDGTLLLTLIYEHVCHILSRGTCSALVSNSHYFQNVSQDITNDEQRFFFYCNVIAYEEYAYTLDLKGFYIVLKLFSKSDLAL